MQKGMVSYTVYDIGVFVSPQYSHYFSLSGEDHDCCFKPTQGGYDCNSDPSYACDVYKPCEILLQIDTTDGNVDGFGIDFGSSKPTAQQMALVEESVHQFCSSGTAGVGLNKCQEICNGELGKDINTFNFCTEYNIFTGLHFVNLL